MSICLAGVAAPLIKAIKRLMLRWRFKGIIPLFSYAGSGLPGSFNQLATECAYFLFVVGIVEYLRHGDCLPG